MTTKVNCLSCKEIIQYREYVEDDYKGALLCDNCGSFHHIKIKGGKVVEFDITNLKSLPPTLNITVLDEATKNNLQAIVEGDNKK